MPLEPTNSLISSSAWSNSMIAFPDNAKHEDMISAVAKAANPMEEMQKALSQALVEAEKHSKVKDTLNTAINWVWNTLWGKPSGKVDTSKPMIPAPEPIDERNRQFFIDDMLQTQERIQELNEEYLQMMKENPLRAESLLVKLMLIILKANLKSKEDQGLVKGKQVELYQDSKLDIEKLHNKASKEASQVDSRRELVQRINTAFSIVLGISTVVSIAMVTAGTALPATVTLITNTGLSTLKAGTTIFQGFLEGTLDEKKKESFLLNTKKELAQEGINVGLDEIRQVMQDMNNLWSLLKDLANRQREASRMIRQ